MSYCRWSCDNHKSDVYCYAHCDGTWTTHVAGRRRIGLENVPPLSMPVQTEDPKEIERWHDLYRAHHAALDRTTFEDIESEHAGETFKDASPQEMIETLLMLRKEGLHVPDHAITALQEEIAEDAE